MLDNLTSGSPHPENRFLHFKIFNDIFNADKYKIQQTIKKQCLYKNMNRLQWKDNFCDYNWYCGEVIEGKRYVAIATENFDITMNGFVISH